MLQCRLHHANCFDWLREQPPASLHGVCTDPPFGIVEFSPQEMTKLRAGRGGVWRLPPTIGGSQRAPLPRFTTLTAQERERVPGAHVFLAGTPALQHLVQFGMAESGFEVRGAVMRLYRGFRGGDRPKLAEREFAHVCVTPRGAYQPWMLFRKPVSEKTVAQNLRKWGASGLRRLNVNQPLPDVIHSGKTPATEESISDHPTLKPQHFLRILVRSLLPLAHGTILDPFCGSGSTVAASRAVGYDAVGVEIDDAYYARLEVNVRQLAALYPYYAGETLDPPTERLSVKTRTANEQSRLFL